jgi:hypothetical protein
MFPLLHQSPYHSSKQKVSITLRSASPKNIDNVEKALHRLSTLGLSGYWDDNGVDLDEWYDGSEEPGEMS